MKKPSTKFQLKERVYTKFTEESLMGHVDRIAFTEKTITYYIKFVDENDNITYVWFKECELLKHKRKRQKNENVDV